MAITISALFAPVQLASVVATIYTVPAAPSTTVLARGRVRFANNDTVARAITAYAVPSGGTASVGNLFMPAESLAANAHVDVDVPLLAAGGTIQAFADVASKVTILPLDGVLFS